MKCSKCHNGNVLMTNMKGREFDWRHIKKVKILIDFELNYCTDCDTVQYEYGDFQRLDDALTESLYLEKYQK